jgi:hypothetical protein
MPTPDLTDQPLFVFGCPRSGTTYLGEVLNRHSRIFLTNELRVMSFLTEVLTVHAQNRHLIHNEDYRDSFLAHLFRSSAQTVRSYYLAKAMETKGRPSEGLLVWGDKTPGYADPVQTPGCLGLTRALFPNAKYIHIRRDPRAVIRSLVSKKWYTLPDSIDIWARILHHGRAWGRLVGPANYLEISYEALCDEGPRETGRILDFLGLQQEPQVTEFLEKEARERTPFSDPITATATIGRPVDAAKGAEADAIREAFGDNPADADACLARYYRDRRPPPDPAEVRATPAAAHAETVPDIALGTAPADLPRKTCRELDRAEFQEVPRESLSGELEARVTDLRLEVARKSSGVSGSIEPGQVCRLSARVQALKNFRDIILGFTAYDEAGRPVFAGNSAGSGLGTKPMPAGLRVADVEFPWPRVPAGTYKLTFGIGEGTDPNNHLIQCWAEKQIVLEGRASGRPATPPTGVLAHKLTEATIF